MTKERFIKSMEAIKNFSDFLDECSGLHISINENDAVMWMQDAFIDLILEELNAKKYTDVMYYFISALDFGRSKKPLGAYQEFYDGNKKIDVSTIDKLWEVLNRENKND